MSKGKQGGGETADMGLEFSAQSVAGYGEPALFVRGSSVEGPANSEGEAFLSALSDSSRALVAAAVAPGLAEGRTTIDQVDIVGPKGDQTIQLTMVPTADGRGVVFVRDVTLETSLRLALIDSRQRYKDFVDISSDFAWEVNDEKRFAFVSPRGGLGYSAAELIEKDPASLVMEMVSGGHNPFTTERRIENVEVWLRRQDGRSACVVTSAMPLRDEDGDWTGARGVCRDVTESREREATLSRVRNRERVLTRIVRSIRDEVNPENMLRAAAETLARGLGAERCQIFRSAPDTDGKVQVEKPADGFVLAGEFGDFHDDMHTAVLETLVKGAGAAEFVRDQWQVLSGPTRFQGQLNGAVILWRHVGRGAWNDDDRLLIGDIANQVGITIEQLTHHERVLRISRTDALTGLLNRGAFMEGLERQLSRLSKGRSSAALIYIDLDNFKQVNDTRGHQAGDEVLLKLRDILLQQTRPTDMVARLGGDEFAVWLNGADLEIAEKRASKFLECAEEMAELSASPDLPLGMSLGIAVVEPGIHETLDGLVARADEAMYEAKHGGKGRYAIARLPAGAAAS